MTAAYRIDGQPAGEDAFYAAACDPQRSVVVEACAGAGKTWMLVSRVMRALLEGTAPEQILAITFTRRAAGEMQQRLDEWLRGYADDASDAAQRTLALRQRGLGAERAAELQAALGGLRRRLLQGERVVEIRTFHAWFAQLALQLPLQLRAQLALPAEFTLLEDPSPLRTELFRRLQRRIAADEGLCADHEALVLGHRRSRVQAWLDAAWQRSEELELADRAGVLEHSVPDASALDPGLAGGIHPLQRLESSGAALRWQALAAELGARSGTKAREAAEGLAAALDAWRGGDRPAAFDRAWSALFTLAGTARKGVGSGACWGAVVDELQALQPLLAQARAHDDHRRLVRLARALRAEYAQLKRERRLVDMGDLERAALALLADPQAAGWVEQRLDQRVRQVLIDEFQDTSPLQWHALYGWLSAYAGAGGGASGRQPPVLFIVGDPKQSIYRFRRAEPRVFEAARDFVVHGLGGQVLACDHTRRNAPEVVKVLNRVFADAASADGWVPFRAHTTGSVDAGRCLAVPAVPRPARAAAAAEALRWRDSLTEPRVAAEDHAKRAEARLVARHVAAFLRAGEVDPQQLMVLARQRAMLRRVADALAEIGVPCVMPEPLALDDSPEAQDLVAVLDVLASPGHDLSLARALKSPLFGCGDADLLTLARCARARREPWLDALPALPAASPALARAARLLAGWRAALADHTPHELLDRIVHEGDLAARLLAAAPAARRPQARQVLRGLLKAALDHDAGRFVSTYAWVRAVRQGLLKVPAGESSAAVRLLTVHGAKGLEAEAVFLVDTQPEPRRAETATLLVDWPVDAAAPRRAAFVASESALPPALQPLLERERGERLREEINTLYVALTRARRHLVVSCTEPFRSSPARTWWQRLQPALQPAGDVAAAVAAVGPAPPPAEVQRLPAAPPPAALLNAAGDAPQDARAAALGRAVHRLLEWIGRPGQALPAAQRLGAARQAVAAQGLPPDLAADAAELAAAIVDGGACARFFGGPALRWAGNEVPLAFGGQVLRVDRLVRLDEGGGPTWWVLDYKLQHRPQQLPALREQLVRYVAAVQAALAASGQGGEPVRAGFITGAGAFVPL